MTLPGRVFTPVCRSYNKPTANIGGEGQAVAVEDVLDAGHVPSALALELTGPDIVMLADMLSDDAADPEPQMRSSPRRLATKSLNELCYAFVCRVSAFRAMPV